MIKKINWFCISIIIRFYPEIKFSLMIKIACFN